MTIQIFPIFMPILSLQTCRNQRRNRKPHKRLQYGWYKNEGMYVMEKHVLVNQRALNVYPGENVGVYPNKTLYALKAGKGGYERVNIQLRLADAVSSYVHCQ